jgi:hypothetical protein
MVSPLQISAAGVSLPLWMAWPKNLLLFRVAAQRIKSHIIIYIYEPMAARLIKLTSNEPMFLCFYDLCVCLSALLSDQSDEHALTLVLHLS